MIYHIHKRLKILTDDNRELTGELLVFDKHMNVVLSDVLETRPVTKKMEKEGIEGSRKLGLVLLRGEHVVSVTVLGEVEQAPTKEKGKRSRSSAAGGATKVQKLE